MNFFKSRNPGLTKEREMAEYNENEVAVPQPDEAVEYTDSQVDAQVDAQVVTQSEPVKTEVDLRIDELRRIVDESKEELRGLVREQEKAVSMNTWEKKLEGMNPVEREALIEALNQSAANAQRLDVTGIDSTEQVNNI